MRKPNHLAILGFLLPFAAAGLTASLVLGVGRPGTVAFLLPYLTLVPGLLIGALASAIKSFRLIAERNDQDYAYAGLTLSLLFLAVYGVSLFYLLY